MTTSISQLVMSPLDNFTDFSKGTIDFMEQLVQLCFVKGLRVNSKERHSRSRTCKTDITIIDVWL